MKYILFILLLCSITVVHAQFITNNGITIVNSADVNTNGDWLNDGSFTNNGSITTTENWVNSGTIETASTGGFKLLYTSTKSFAPGTGSFGFLEKGGAGDVDVSGSFTVKNRAKFTLGLIRLMSPSDIITLGARGSTFNLEAAGTTSYIEGTVAHQGIGDYIIPIGKDGLYLPITFYKVSGTNPLITVTLEDAPVGYTAGRAVDALIDFPYVWRSVKTNVSDTSSHVEINYPNTLPTAENLIVARKVSGQDMYEGMGARIISDVGGRIKVRSYSRRLQGLFTIATGYKANMETDSLALVALYHSTGGPTWTTKTNWLTGTVDTWSGVTRTAQTLTDIVLPANNLVGPVPDHLSDILGLVKLDLSDNKITAIPDFTAVNTLNSVDVSNNNLDFTSLVANAPFLGANIDYTNQAEIGVPLDVQVDVNSNYKLKVPDRASGNVYEWFRQDVKINASDSTYIITGINRSNMGEYVTEITNPAVPGLRLKTKVQRVLATATLTGKLLRDTDLPATGGKVTLFRVTAIGGYDTIKVNPIQNDGAFLFDKVILDDYQLLGYADTLLAGQEKALPTYYKNTIFWEEADTLFVNDNLASLDILTQFKPTPPKDGQGAIGGTLLEDDRDQSGGRVQRQKPVARAGASVRRAERTGRGEADKYVLVAYVFTDENGQFNFSKLDPGEYRLNLQYPGYPMDETSFINIVLGSSLLDRQVAVEAEVKENKISVRKLVIVGWQEEKFTFDAYPNPTSEHLFISAVSGSSRDMTFSILNSEGRKQSFTSTFDEISKRWMLNVSGLQKGVYLVKVKRQGDSQTLKIIIE